MKSAKIRRVLESKILRLKSCKKPLSQNEFEEYCSCLKRLFLLEQRNAIRQNEIHSCAYGSMEEFVKEFIRYSSPLIYRARKKMRFNNVHHSRTYILFSPRLAEIALGGIITAFLLSGDSVSISVFNINSGVAVCASGKRIYNSERLLRCIGHIAHLHGGRYIVSFCRTQSKIIITFPFFPSFQPLKLVPCSTELCRLCNI